MHKNFILNICSASMICFSLFLANNVSHFTYGYLYFIASSSILVFFILYKLLSSYKDIVALPYNLYILFIIFFLFWSSLSVFWSPVFSDSFTALTLMYLLPIGILIGFWSNKEQQKIFYTLLIFLLLIIFWKSTQQKLISFPSQQAKGFFENKNTNGIFVCMILFPIFTKFLSNKLDKYSQYTYGTILFLGAFIISLTVSRGAVLGLVIGLLLLLIYTILSKLPFRNFLQIIATLCAGYFSAELVNNSRNWHRLTERTLSTDIASISNGRDFLWQSGWEMYLEHPFFGWGFNMFHLLFPQYRHAPDIGMYVHNDYFQFLIELGPIGLLLFIGFLINFLTSSKKLYTASSDQNDKLEALGLIAACIAIFVHSFFTFNLYQAAPLLLIGLYIGVITQKLNALTQKNTFHFQANTSNRVTATGYYGVLFSTASLFILVASMHVISLKKIYDKYDNNLTFLEEAENAYFYMSYGEHILATQLNIYSSILYNKKNNLTSDAKNYLINRAIKVSDEAIEKNPYRVSNFINRAQLYSLASNEYHPNRINEISKAYDKAIEIDPFDRNARIAYANELLSQDNKQAAIEVLSGGLNRRYHDYYSSGIRYLQLLFALISDSGNELAINSVKQQIDALLDKKKPVGYYTLNSIS